MSDEAIYGLTLQDCAEIMSKDGELKAQYGEPAYLPYLEQFLTQRGTDQNTWAHAWNGWWERMQADPSGQLHAKFATMQQQLTMQAHFADVPDASGDAKEGVTLDTYAKVMAGAAGGQDMQQLVQAEGIAWDQWQRAQAAWNQAMSEDVNHHLTTQYGQLYAKYTPGHQQQMEGQVAAIMAADHAQREQGPADDEPEVEYTFDMAMGELQDPKPTKRWTAAHHLANFYDIGDLDEEPHLAQALQAIPVMIECLERHDEYTVSEAEALAGDLVTLGEAGALTREQADEAKSSIEICLNRGREKLQTLQAAFAPIADKAVPERVKMQSQIQDYTSLVEELAEKLEDWDDDMEFNDGSAAAPAAAAPGAAMVPATPSAPSTPSAEGGFLALLKKLPIIGNILRLLGL